MSRIWITGSSNFVVTQQGDTNIYTERNTGACYHIRTQITREIREDMLYVQMVTFCNGAVVSHIEFREGERGILRYNEIRREQAEPLAISYGESHIRTIEKAS